METACGSVTACYEDSSIMNVHVEVKEGIFVAYTKKINYLIKNPTTRRQILEFNQPKCCGHKYFLAVFLDI
jgi:hypothetical protein